MNKLILVVLVVLVLGFLLFWRFFWPGTSGEQFSSDATVKIGAQTYKVQIADTPALQTQGLSERKALPQNEGMLFVFPTAKLQAFWMKKMLFPIDILWIVNNQVVGVVENAPPDNNLIPAIYSSPKDVDLVLEVNAGVVARDKISVGDSVEIIGYTRK